MEAWRQVWREAIAPQLSVAGLTALAEAIREDDSRLIQGSTTKPPPLYCMSEVAAEGACAVTFSAWQGDGVPTIGRLEEFFARVCRGACVAMGAPCVSGRFLQWYDETPRAEMRRELLPEVELALEKRKAA